MIARSEEEARRLILKNEKDKKINLKIEQDPDVLDTWFSSALLPLTAMGWPDPVNLQSYIDTARRADFFTFFVTNQWI